MGYNDYLGDIYQQHFDSRRVGEGRVSGTPGIQCPGGYSVGGEARTLHTEGIREKMGL